MIQQPIASIVVTTYNHEEFISSCLEGIVNQSLFSECELLIGEDGSSDSTLLICEKYKRLYPDNITLIRRKRENVHYLFGKPTGRNNLLSLLKMAKSEYVFLCEGDDVWTDALKINTQIELFKTLPKNVSGIFHQSCVIDEHSKLIEEGHFTLQNTDLYDQVSCYRLLKSSYATCSLAFRKSALFPLPRYFSKYSCDFFLDIALTRSGGELFFLNKTMSAYRKHQGGIWQGKRDAYLFRIRRYRAWLLMLYSNLPWQIRLELLMKYLLLSVRLLLAMLKSR